MSELLKKKYGNVVEGPQGLRMPEHVARAIETAAKSLPQDFTFRRRAKNADMVPDGDERTDISTITTDAVDRDEEVLLPGGGDWAEFKSNPFVSFNHEYDELPVGTCRWIKAKGNSLIAKTFYPTKPEDWGDSPWLPSAILHLLQQDPPVCTGKSVGFLPLNVRQASTEEKSRKPEWKGLPIIDKWIGLEYAVAPMPCNPEASMISVTKSADVDDHAIQLVTKAFTANLSRIKQKVKTSNIADAAEAALQEAAANVAASLPYYTVDEFRYALLRRLDFTDAHRDTVQAAIVDAFDRALGVV